MRIGEYIKYKRQSLGYSQMQLAERLEISKQAVGKWENGTALPDVMKIPDIATVLKVKPEFLMKIIWTGETGEYVKHFVFVNVKEKSHSSYSIKVYEADDFGYVKEIYDEIKAFFKCHSEAYGPLELVLPSSDGCGFCYWLCMAFFTRCISFIL